MWPIYSHVRIMYNNYYTWQFSREAKMDGVEKVKQAIAATIQSSQKQSHLVKDGKCLAKVMSLLHEDIGIIFCGKMVALLRTCFVTVHQRREELAREMAMTRFHVVRIRELPTLWMDLFSDLSLGSASPLLLQSVNRSVFEQMMVDHFAESVEASGGSSVAELPTMNAEEENVLRYVSGYVALKLMRLYEKNEGEKATQFVECLSNMAVPGVESTFYEYTKEWITAIDRGGLFHISDSAYHLFRAIEEETRQILPCHLANPHNSRDALLEEIKENEDVLFYWSIMSIDIHSPEDADELLKAVIKLWLTIRGYSLTAAMFEEYKKAHHSSSKKKALRKDLWLQQVD